MLSPAVYLRCSENSTEKPWNGLACNPAMNPSTMNLARRSSRATWRMTAGFRYFSAVPAIDATCLASRKLENLGCRSGDQDLQAVVPVSDDSDKLAPLGSPLPR